MYNWSKRIRYGITITCNCIWGTKSNLTIWNELMKSQDASVIVDGHDGQIWHYEHHQMNIYYAHKTH